MRTTGALLLAGITWGCAADARAQVIAGRVDDFQDGTTLGWTNGGSANAPINVPTGGPAGAGDAFLQIMANGGLGAGSRMIAFNRTRWNGDFTSPAITTVSMDLKVTSGPALKVRIAMKSGQFQNSPGYVSITPFDLPADGLWHHATFGINTGSLMAIGSPSPLNLFLQNVVEFRVLHSNLPSLDGDVILANMGVDNITPVAVPEPSAMLLAAAGGVGLIQWRRRRHATSRS